MSKTGAELKQHAIVKDQDVSVFDDATSYEPTIQSGRLVLAYQHQTGTDENDNPTYAEKRETIKVDQSSLETLCAAVATALSGQTFTGEQVEAIFKAGFETEAIG